MPDDSSATAYPIVIAEWQRNSREIIRIALDQYKGRDIVDARAWWRDEDGNWRPGRNGLTLSLKHLPSLAEGLGDAVRRARQLGIIDRWNTGSKIEPQPNGNAVTGSVVTEA